MKEKVGSKKKKKKLEMKKKNLDVKIFFFQVKKNGTVKM